MKKGWLKDETNGIINPGNGHWGEKKSIKSEDYYFVDSDCYIVGWKWHDGSIITIKQFANALKAEYKESDLEAAL